MADMNSDTGREFISDSEADTAALAVTAAGWLRRGDVLCLQGDLGSGKTLFARALIRHLCADPALEVPSPTFSLVQSYDGSAFPIWHFDLYRLEDSREIYELGWEDALGDALIIAEWPERLGATLPADRLDLIFAGDAAAPARRRITALARGGWKAKS